MAIVQDASGNSPVGFAVEQHNDGRHDVAALRPEDPATVSPNGSSVQVGPFDPSVRYLRVAVNGGDAYYAIGANPTAAATSNFLGDNGVDYVKIRAGEKIALFCAAGATVVHVAEAK